MLPLVSAMTIYEDAAPHVVGAVLTLFLLAILTFGLRVYVRFGQTWGPEDTSMAIAMVSIYFESVTRGHGSSTRGNAAR